LRGRCDRQHGWVAAVVAMTYNRRMPANLLIPALVSSLLDVMQPSAPAPQPDLTTIHTPGGVARPMPANTKKGQLTPGPAGAVIIDGNALPLSVAAQIRNENNLIVQPSTLRQPVTVRYQTDASGAVLRVWILTAAEVAAVDRKN
jgi:hypothetical protein